MIYDPKSDRDSEKAYSSKDKLPSELGGLGATIEQCAADNPERSSKREAYIACNHIREPSGSELLWIFLIGWTLGFGVATVFWAFLRHI